VAAAALTDVAAGLVQLHQLLADEAHTTVDLVALGLQVRVGERRIGKKERRRGGEEERGGG